MVKRDRDEDTGEVIDAEPVDRTELLKVGTDAKTGRFVKGNALGGRPKGARSKIEEAFLRDFCDNWKRRGPDAIDRACDADPMGYIRVAASLLPRVKPQGDDDEKGDVNVNVTIQVNDFMSRLQAVVQRHAEAKALAKPEEPDDSESEGK